MKTYLKIFDVLGKERERSLAFYFSLAKYILSPCLLCYSQSSPTLFLFSWIVGIQCVYPWIPAFWMSNQSMTMLESFFQSFCDQWMTLCLVLPLILHDQIPRSFAYLILLKDLGYILSSIFLYYLFQSYSLTIKITPVWGSYLHLSCFYVYVWMLMTNPSYEKVLSLWYTPILKMSMSFLICQYLSGKGFQIV